MCDSQRELAALEHIYENARVALAREDEVYLLAHASRASLEVVADCLFEVGEAGAGVVEVRDSLVQGVARIVREQALEGAKSFCGVIECFRVVNGLAGVRVGDEVIASPAFAVVRSEVGLALFCEDSDDILHKLVRILENIRVYQLNKVAYIAAVGIFEVNDKSVVYVAVV